VQWAEGLPPEIEQRFWFGWVEGGGYVSARVLREGMEAFNRRLLEVAARLDVPCLDLSSMHGDARWFFDDCHFSEAGARRAAELVAEWMRAHPEAWRP
jgi:lysophospholipase L1-like esterase